MTRVFFSCDAHGSVPVLRKMARVHEAYKCSVVMMCGDLTGKAIVPIVEEKPGVWWTSPWGKKETYKSLEEVDRAKKAYEDSVRQALRVCQETIEQAWGTRTGTVERDWKIFAKETS